MNKRAGVFVMDVFVNTNVDPYLKRKKDIRLVIRFV